MNRKDIFLNYLYEFVLCFDLTHVIWPTFLIIKGFSLIDVGICESVFHITSMFAELPTGMISDLYGRKFSRLLGRVMNLMSITLLLFFSSFTLVIVSFVLNALSYNLESGTDDAYVYDLLLKNNEEEKFAQIKGVREIILQVAMFLSLFISGIISDYSYRLTYGLAFIVCLISILVLCIMKEIKNEHYQKKSVILSMREQFVSSFSLLKHDHNMIGLIVTYALFSAAPATVYYYITNYWYEAGISMSKIAFYLSLENIAGILAGIVVGKILIHFVRRKILYWVPLGISIALMGVPFFPISIICIATLAFFESLLYVTISTFLNERVESAYRATLLSTMSMAYSIAMILYFPLIGLLGNLLGLYYAFIILVLINLVVFIYYQKQLRRFY